MKIFSRILSGFILSSLILSVALTPSHSARAIPVLETNPAVITGSVVSSNALPVIAAATKIIAGVSIQNASANTGHFLEQVYQWAKDILMQALKKAILGYLTDRVIAYIQGDSNGAVVGDWQSYLSGVVATELGRFGQQLTGVDICSPFSAQIKLAFRLPPVQKFGYNITCTFDEIGENIDDFMGDFQNGGWIAYEKMWEPGNNGYGVFLSASIEQAARVIALTDAAKSEGEAGNGFLDKKECDEDPGQAPQSNPYTEGLMGDQSISLDAATTRDIDGDGTPGDIPSTCKVLTPGTVVAQAVKKAAVDVDFDFVLMGEDLTPYVAAIADAMVGRVLSEGLALITPSADTSDINNYVDTRPLQRSENQQFRTHRTRLSNKVNDALRLRETAQLTINGASSYWLKNMDGEEDPAKAALEQVRIARRALLYTHEEINKVTLNSQLKNRQNPSCEVVSSLGKINNEALPRIRKMVTLASELIETLEIAHDDLPELDPDFENPCVAGQNGDLSTETDITCEDNLDQIAILRYAQNAVANELLENTPETRQLLLDLNSLIGDDSVTAANQFRTDIRKVDDQIEELFRATSAYASRLRACFVPRNPADPTQPIAPGTQGVVIPWLYPLDDGNEDYDKPARPFPWEKSDTATQNIDPADPNSTPDQTEQAATTTNP